MHQFKAAILLYQSSLERKNFVELTRTQLFYLVFKVTKSLALPEVCSSSKTNRATGITFFRVDNDAVVREILMIKYGTIDKDKRAMEMKFVNHMVDFSFKIGTTYI